MCVDDLAAILAKPTDAPGLRGTDPKRAASLILSVALNPDKKGELTTFDHAIETLELSGPLQLYRMFDWRRGEAWGNWWVEKNLLEQIVEAAERRSFADIYDRQAFVLKLLRSFVVRSPRLEELWRFGTPRFGSR